MEEKRIIQAKCNEFVHFSNQIFILKRKINSIPRNEKKTFPIEVVGCFPMFWPRIQKTRLINVYFYNGLNMDLSVNICSSAWWG